MTGATEERLEQAYALIQQEKLEDAISLLQPILLQDSTNVDAWWLYANAVEAPAEARDALEKVLRYDPTHADAQRLLDNLNELYPPADDSAEPASFFFGEDVDFDELLADTDIQDPVDLAGAEVLELVEAPPDIPPLPPMGALDSETVAAGAGLKSLDFESEAAAPALDLGDFLAGDNELPDFDDDMPDFDDEPVFEGAAPAAEKAAAVPRRRPLRRLLMILVLLVVIIGAVLVVVAVTRPTGTTPPPTQNVLVPSDAMQGILETASGAANAQSSMLGGSAEAQLVTLAGESALVIRVCRPSGTDIGSAMGAAMTLAAQYGAVVQDEIAAVGAELVNCQRDDVLLRAVAPIEEAVAFRDGSLPEGDFRATWQWLP